MTRDELIERMAREWSDPSPPSEECRYDHTIAGEYRIEWKSWKDCRPSYGIFWREEYVGTEYNLAAAKNRAANHRIDRALETLPIPGLADVLDGKAVIVPVGPSAAMVDVGARSLRGAGLGRDCYSAAGSTYAAMIEARPK